MMRSDRRNAFKDNTWETCIARSNSPNQMKHFLISRRKNAAESQQEAVRSGRGRGLWLKVQRAALGTYTFLLAVLTAIPL